MRCEFRLGVFLVAAVLFVGCASTGSKKAAIESVFQQRAQIKARVNPSNIDEMAAARERVIAGYKAINVSHCPEDFRNAWFDYVVEVESASAKQIELTRQALANGRNEGDLASLMKLVGAGYLALHGGLAPAGTLLASIEPNKSGPKNAEVARQMRAVQQGLDNAWKKLERVAMNYGVTPTR